VSSAAKFEAYERAGTDEPERRHIRFESAPEFLARVEAQPPPGWRVRDLLPDDGIAVWHGRPRSMKSLGALEANLAGATDTPAFGNERFATTPHPGSFLYLTEEDAERVLAFRLRLMLAGRGLDMAPRRLRLLARPGWNLEVAADQGAILAAIQETDPPPICITIDPARGSMPSLDKGPADASPAIRFVRFLMRETSIRTVLIPHHDVKPARDGRDDRARAERASGGAVFSIADCPVGFERLDDRTCLAVPSAYKLGADPKPFRVEFRSETPAGEPFRGFLRAVAVTTDERSETAAKVEGDILRVLDEADGWLKTDDVVGPVKGRREKVLEALRKLTDAGKVTVRPAGSGKGKEYRRGLAS
jgi:hypothetical protein